ncbi:MAG: hypothetical protein Q9213_005401 [Squamulea squamosa]
MDRAIAQALNSLIPEWNNVLPKELLDLAASLLAQSRNRASSLKAEEEIARTYACAHLACERLKQSIGLPKIQSRPPCPPRVYQKLYRHLDSALVAGAKRTARAPIPLDSQRPTKAPLTTPQKSARISAPTPYPAGRKRKRLSAIMEEVPSWAMTAIRGLCKHLEVPVAPPHVFAGVSSILTLPPPDEESIKDDDIDRLRTLSVEALIVVVYMFVRTRLSGMQMDPSAFPEQRDRALTVLSQLRDGGETLTAIDPTNVDDWMSDIVRGRWTELDWFANIGEGAGLGLDDSRSVHVNESDSGDLDEDERVVHGKRETYGHGSEKPYLQPGLGTMVPLRILQRAVANLFQMQDRVDYLSDAKRADYQIWKKDFLARIDRMERAEQVREPVAL